MQLLYADIIEIPLLPLKLKRFNDTIYLLVYNIVVDLEIHSFYTRSPCLRPRLEALLIPQSHRGVINLDDRILVINRKSSFDRSHLSFTIVA